MMALGSSCCGHGSSSTLSPLAQPFTVDHYCIKKPTESPAQIADQSPSDPYNSSSRPYNPSLRNWLHLGPIPDGLFHSSMDLETGITGMSSSHAVGFGYFDKDLNSSYSRNFSYSEEPEPLSSNPIEAETYFPQYPLEVPDACSSLFASSGSSRANLVGSSGYESAPVTVNSERYSMNNFDCFGNPPGYVLETKWKSPWIEPLDGQQGQGKGHEQLTGEWFTKWPLSSVNGACSQDLWKHQPGGLTAHEKPHGIWQGKQNEYCGSQVPSKALDATFSDPSLSTKVSDENAQATSSAMPRASSVSAAVSALEDTSNPKFADLMSFGPTWNPLNRNPSTFDSYISDMESCPTTNPTIFYPSMTSLSPSQTFRPQGSAIGNSTGDISIDAQDGSNQLDAKEEDHTTTNGVPEERTDTQQRLSNFYAKHAIPYALNFCTGVFGTSNAIPSSLGTINQPISPIDSASWKPAPDFQYPTYGPAQNGNPQTLVDESVQFMGLKQCQQAIAVSDDEEIFFSPKLPAYHPSPSPSSQPSVTMTSLHETENNFGCTNETISTICERGSPILAKAGRHIDPRSESPSVPKDNKEPIIFEAGMTENEETNGHTSDGLPDFFQPNESVQDLPSNGVGCSNAETCEALNGSLHVSNGSLVPRVDSHLLVNMMHNLSDLLHSSCCLNTDALKESDFDVLSLILRNLHQCILKKRGLSGDLQRSYCFGGSHHVQNSADMDKGHAEEKSPIAGIEVKDAPSQCNNEGHDTVEGSMPPGSPRKPDDSHKFVATSNNMAFKKDNDITQDMEKTLKKSFDEEGSQDLETLLYKNLWIESEAALCTMKYELKSVQMKLEMERSKQLVEKVGTMMESVNLEETITNSEVKSAKATCNTSIEDVQPTSEEAKETSTNHKTKPDEKPDEKVEAQSEDITAVMARFMVLKNRKDPSVSPPQECEPRFSLRSRSYSNLDFLTKLHSSRTEEEEAAMSIIPSFSDGKTETGRTQSAYIEGKERLFAQWEVETGGTRPVLRERQCDSGNRSGRPAILRDVRVCGAPPVPAYQTLGFQRYFENPPGQRSPFPESPYDWEHVLWDELV
ncbi:uncharacterized protein LOC18436345 [Amborella trichopoda]|nr:uncharacterized protein LOC18436345 [Amborella trichopoda]|eukprot:XP_006846430.2 uncharacterized protein LOC18436345 [Amborella trichopoda]